MRFPTPYGGFTLLSELGAGGQAQVFLARRGAGPLLVLKRLLPGARAAEAQHFEHPNIVRVFDSGEAEGQRWLTMEYLAGQSVAALLGKLSPELCAGIIARACDGLHHAHALNAVHRDVSPQNVLVTYGGEVKVLDFGSPEGKVAYLAPEQCREEPVDRRADVFALGVVLTELLTGQRMFDEENEHALIRARALGEYAKPSQRFEADAAMLAICDRATAFRAGDRYASCAELKRDLAAWPATREQLTARMSALFATDIALREQLLKRSGPES